METVIRVSLIFLLVTITLRIVGKRELAEMSPYELVMIMLIPEIVSQSLIREDFSFTNGLIGITTLLSLVYFNSLLSFKFKKYQDTLQGKPMILFNRGMFVEGALERERIRPEEILEEVRGAGYEKLEQIKWVVLEPDGKMSCIPYEQGQRSQQVESIQPH